MKKLLFINGPNLNMLGSREPEIYGHTTLTEVEAMVIEKASGLDIMILRFQSNHEGAIIDFVQEHYDGVDGIIINPGALTHYGYSLRDCLAGTGLPIVEVHISNLDEREAWRKQSVLSDICTGVISGLGVTGYLRALEYFTEERGKS